MAQENKTQPSNSSVKQLIDTLDDEQQRQDTKKLVKMIHDATGEQPVMWGSSIIGFGDNSYTTSDNVERGWFHVGFSPRKGKLSLYLMTGFDEYAVHAGFDPQPYLDKLGPYKTGKSCLYIKRLSDVDTDVLRELVAASYHHQQDAD